MIKILPMRIGEKIRKVREIRDVSQEYMANQLGISQTYYSKIERGGAGEVTVDRLEKIAKILKVTPSDILNFNEKQVFNSTFNNYADSQSSNVVWMNSSFEREREQYEARIKHLEKTIDFLQEMLRDRK